MKIIKKTQKLGEYIIVVPKSQSKESLRIKTLTPLRSLRRGGLGGLPPEKISMKENI